MAVKPQKPSLEDVHAKIALSKANPGDKERAAYAVDAIKLFGIDDFFCVYDDFLSKVVHAGTLYNNGPLYIYASKLYYGSKQHWRRRT
jgi:hypothetical protein